MDVVTPASSRTNKFAQNKKWGEKTNLVTMKRIAKLAAQPTQPAEPLQPAEPPQAGQPGQPTKEPTHSS